MQWQPLSNIEILKRLEIPSADSGKVLDMVLDTDTYNEVDDQFALCYALCSPERLNVQAVYAAPFFNDRSNGPEQGMERSYDEIVRLLGKMGHPTENFVFKGSRDYLKDMDTPQDSPAARDLVARGMARPDDDPLYVVAIGAITNVASALIMEPRLARKIIVVWLGGHSLTHTDTREFNLMQDVPAARTVLDSGVPFILVPCIGVASHLLTSVPELQACIGGKNELCDTLIDILMGYNDDHFAWGKEIWDISTIAMLINPDWEPTTIEPSPLLSDDCHWSRDARRHPIKVAYFAYRNPIFRDVFKKLAAFKKA